MVDSLRQFAARLGRWPRRIAAVACLVLAAASAVAPHPAAESSARRGLAATLGRGEVAVPVAVDGAADYVHPGDRVGVLAVPGDARPRAPAVLVADRLRVLAVHTDGGVDAAASVVMVVTRREGALRLARYSASPLRLLVDRFP